MMIPKAWGTEETIVNDGFCGKRMRVLEGFRCSVHRHAVKDEAFYVEEGLVWMEVGESPDSMIGTWLQEGDRLRVRPGTWHRFWGVRDSVMFEFSTVHDDADVERASSSSKIPEAEFQGLLRRLVAEGSKVHLDLERAAIVASDLKSRGKVVGMVNGCFDLLHPGHVELLRQARERCDVLFVGVNTDKSVRELKGEGRPFVPEAGRMVMLGSNRYVDYVVPIDEPTCVALAEAIKPALYFKTTEHGDSGHEARMVKSHGGKVVVVELLPGYHTTSIAGNFR